MGQFKKQNLAEKRQGSGTIVIRILFLCSNEVEDLCSSFRIKRLVQLEDFMFIFAMLSKSISAYFLPSSCFNLRSRSLISTLSFLSRFWQTSINKSNPNFLQYPFTKVIYYILIRTVWRILEEIVLKNSLWFGCNLQLDLAVLFNWTKFPDCCSFGGL